MCATWAARRQGERGAVARALNEARRQLLDVARNAVHQHRQQRQQELPKTPQEQHPHWHQQSRQQYVRVPLQGGGGGGGQGEGGGVEGAGPSSVPSSMPDLHQGLVEALDHRSQGRNLGAGSYGCGGARSSYDHNACMSALDAWGGLGCSDLDGGLMAQLEKMEAEFAALCDPCDVSVQ